MRNKCFIFILGFALLGCGVERTSIKDFEKPAEVAPSLTRTDTAVSHFTLFYTPHAQGNLAFLLDVLNEYPMFRPTLIFPPKYFEQMGRSTLIPALKTLLEENRVEIGMDIGSEPPLPLICDLKAHTGKIVDWRIEYKWPEDATAQLAKARMAYLERWGRYPSGIYPPFGALSLNLIKTLQLFKFAWAMVEPQADSGSQTFDSLMVLSPAALELDVDEDEDVERELKLYCRTLFKSGVVRVDANIWANSDWEKIFFEEMAELAGREADSQPMLFTSDYSDSFNRQRIALQRVDVFQYDFSPWVKTERQRLAWKALSMARKVVENYKNSGQANIRKLDAAMDEIYQAESGPFLLSLGIAGARDLEDENEFLATLSNVFRLSETQVPANFHQWFSFADRKTNYLQGADSDRPFFVAGEQHLQWNDPEGDDFGDGNLTYPMGKYDKGAFDLASFSVSWTDAEVLFSMALGVGQTLPDNGVIPLVDVYVDVNRLSGAGSIDPLPNRTNCVIDRSAAWEYGLTFNSSKADLFQPIPGQSPRKINSFVPDVSSDARIVTVRLPKSIFRGDPERWRFTVGVMGTDSSWGGAELRPIPVGVNSKQKNFGGGMTGKKCSPFIDILAADPESQIAVLSVYRTGAQVNLPFVEAE